MEREIIGLESLRRAALASPAPTAREELVAELLLDCLRELHAAAARMARDGGGAHAPRIVRGE